MRQTILSRDLRLPSIVVAPISPSEAQKRPIPAKVFHRGHFLGIRDNRVTRLIAAIGQLSKWLMNPYRQSVRPKHRCRRCCVAKRRYIEIEYMAVGLVRSEPATRSAARTLSSFWSALSLRFTKRVFSEAPNSLTPPYQATITNPRIAVTTMATLTIARQALS